MKNSWQIKKIGEICDILDNERKPVTKRDRMAGDYPYYGATGVLDYVKDYLFDEKLVLIGEDGAKWGAGEFTAFSVDGKYWVNNHAHVLRPCRNTVLDKWIIYFFYLNDVTIYTTGLTVPKLNQGNLRIIEIPLPQLEEQKLIIEILDGVFEAIERAKENTEKNLQNSRELFKSHLQCAFANPGKDWDEKKLGNVCEELFAGGDVPKNNCSKIKTNDFTIPIFSNGEKNKGLYGYTNVIRVKKPSITISARGTIGYSEIREEPFYPAIRLIVATPNAESINLYFLQYIIRNMNFIHSGTSIPQLTVPMIKEYSAFIPLLNQQKTIVDKLDELSAKTKKLEEIYMRKLSDFEELKKSVLQKAFNGELIAKEVVGKLQAEVQ